MEHSTIKKNRLMTVLLTILCSVAIFGCALFMSFGFKATAEETGGTYAAYKYTLTEVTVSFNDGWIFTSDTPDSELYKMVSVSVKYTDADGGESIERVLELSADNKATTGESVDFVRNTTAKTVTATVTPAGDDYDPAAVSGTSAAYTLSSTSQVVVNGITAFYTASGYEVTTDTSLWDGDFMNCIKVYETYNDGSINPSGAVGAFSLSGDLFPSDLTNGLVAGDTYNKAITVVAGEGSERRTTSVLITDIKFVAPNSVYYIAGALQTQVARSKRLNMDGLTVSLGYSSGPVTVPYSIFPSGYFKYEFTDQNKNPVSSLSTSVKNIKITFTYPSIGSVSQSFNNITVSRISVHTPVFPDGINATKSMLSWNNDGASVDITNWDFDDLYTDGGDAPNPVLSVVPANAPAGEDLSEFYSVTDGAQKKTVKFLKAGYLYHLYVTLPSGGDFMWGSPYNGIKSDDNMTMTFDVQVDKGTPVVTLAGIADTTYGTANGSGKLSAKIKDDTGALNDMDEDWSDVTSYPVPDADTYKDDDEAWHYRLEYYTNSAATSLVSESNRRTDGRPKKVGTYYAVAITYENGEYKSVKSNAVMFKVNKYTIDTDIADKTFARTDWTINDFIVPNDGTAKFPYQETALDILDVTDNSLNVVDGDTKFRHANEYTVNVEVKSTHTANYQLTGEVASDSVTFKIKTNTDSTFDFDLSGWVYGDSDANPKLTVTSKSGSYYPINTGTLTTDYTVKYYLCVSTTDGDGNTVLSKGDEITIADFKALAVGGYFAELTANKDTTDAEETAAIADDPDVDYTTVDYILPVVYKDFWVNASAIVAPYLDLIDTNWAELEEDGGLLYTYDDTNANHGEEYELLNWIANNTAADGTSKIITIKISYTTLVSDTTVVVYDSDTINDAEFANGKFKVNYAGKYKVTVTLNKNYSWATKDADDNDIWHPDEQSYSYFGYVARQQLTVLTDGNVSGATDVYDSTSQEKTISGWNSNALKITTAEVKGLETGHTPVSGGIVTPTDNSNKFSVRNAGIYTVTVDIDDQDNYEWKVLSADPDADILRPLSLEYTLDRAPMKVTWGTNKLDGTFDKTDNTKFPRFQYDGGRNTQSVPTAAVKVFDGDAVTISASGYKLYNIAIDDGADVFGTQITSGITAVGHYRIVVSQIGGAAAPNYYLPENDAENITRIATVFEIYAKTFARPVLDGGDGVTISDNKNITVVYNGNGYRLSQFIQDFETTYKLNDIVRLDIKYGEDGENDPLLKDVLWDADSNLIVYNITVTPVANYAWSTGTADETLEFTIKITQKTVEIDWGDATDGWQTTYGDVQEPAPTVLNAETGETVNIDTLGYYDKDDADVEDITVANAGVYTVYAATLDNLNYKIDSTRTDHSVQFTIKKKALNMPTLDTAMFFGKEFGGAAITTGSSLYYNGESEQAEWQTEDGNMLFTAAVTARRDNSWFTDGVDDGDDVLVIDTSDADKYSFDTEEGKLTYYAAGIYTVMFTLTDSANYCWAGADKETAFDDTFADNEGYTCVWGTDKELTVARKEIDAPKLGNERAMEFTRTIEYRSLSAIFNGATQDGVTYGVKYGTRAEGGGFQDDNLTVDRQDADEEGNVGKKRGQYYVVLTAADSYNYSWNVSADKDDGTFLKSSFIDPKIGGNVYKIEYTVADGAKVYLLYAITAAQLDVKLEVNDYTYGANGYAIGNTVIAKADKAVCDTFGDWSDHGDIKIFDYQNHDDHTGNSDLPDHSAPVYEFFKLKYGKRNENDSAIAAADLVEGLPWEPGEYEVKVYIGFDDADAYQPWSNTYKFTVLPRKIELVWKFGDDEENNTKPNGGTFTTTYSGEEQKPEYVITNIPQKEAGITPTAPQLTFQAVDTGKEAFVDAATYYINSVQFKGNSSVNDNFALANNYRLTFVIQPKEVKLTATGQNHTYGDSLTFDASECLTSETIAYFEERDGLVVIMQVQNATDTVLTNTLDVTCDGDFYLVPMLNSDNIRSTNYKVVETNRAKLTVNKRAITVTVIVTDDKPSSVYSEDIADITYDVSLTSGSGTAVVDSEAEVFTIAARDSSDAVITSLTNVGKYDIVLTLGARGGNYDITFGTTHAAEGATTVKHEAYKYTINPKQIEEDNNSIAANSLTYNGGDQEFLADGYAVVIGNPEIAGNAPVWSYVQTDSTYSTDGKTFTTFTQSPTVKNAGTYYFVIKVTAANHTELTKEIEVTVQKAELTVKFNLTIMFGEDDPASVQYLFGTDNLRTQNIGWTVTGFVGANSGEADRNLFYSDQDFYGLVGEAKYAVVGYDKASLTTEYSITFIATKDGNPTLTCDNYTFVGEVGTLTVKKVALTVSISDQQVIYNADASDIPSVNVPGDSYTVSPPNSTYDANALYAMQDDFIQIVTISTTAHDVKTGTSTTGNAGSYAITGAVNEGFAEKYAVTFVGGWNESLTATADGTCGKYTIKPAEFTVNDIANYTGDYDEKWHGIIVGNVNTVQPDDGTPTAGVVLATASDGTDVKVEFGMSKSQLGVLSDATFNALNPSQTAPACRNKGRYYVYYRLSNDNYTTVLDGRMVNINIADNEISTHFDFQNKTVVLQGQTAKTAWTYGYKGTDGFDPDDANVVIEPEVKFIYSGTTADSVGKITFTLFYNDSSIWTNQVNANAADTIKNMFEELFAGNGLNAGSYKLTVAMEDTANYYGFTTVYVFNVAKRALTVQAATPDDIVYGGDIPTFTDASVGLVVNSSKADATADSITAALGAAPNYVTEYKQGDNAGKSYRVYVNGKADGDTDATSFTNYAVTYKDAFLTVNKREITVSIADKVNTYSLRDANGDTETIETLTFTVTDGSIYTAELVGGAAPEGGVYTNTNQTVLTLYTQAIVDDNTNNVIFDSDGKVTGYTIYAVFNGGAATNYQISFADCSNKEETETDAIGRDGSGNNAGSYTIIKAIFKVVQDGVYHKVGDKNVKGTVYSGAVNKYVATLDDTSKTPIEFTYTKKGSDGNYVPIDEVVEVGEYQALGSSANPNYTAADLTIYFEITKATITLTAKPTEVQYGTTLSGVVATDKAAGGAEATGRFGGFTYTASSETLLDDTLEDYLNDNTVGYKTTGYNAKTSAGTQCAITPVCVSDSNVTVAPVEATLTVAKRQVTVTMVGWDDTNDGDNSKHNGSAWCYYLGTHDATLAALVNSFNSNLAKYIYIADEKAAFGDSENTRSALDISVGLPEGVNVGEHAFTYAAGSNTNYSVTFANEVAPKFSVQKAQLTLYAHPSLADYSYTYGQAIDTLVEGNSYSVGNLYYFVEGMQNKERFVEFLGDRNIVFTIVDSNGKTYEAWKSNVGTYTVSLMVRDGDNDYDPTDAEVKFQNYEIVEVKNVSLILNKRKISASTKDQTFGFDGTTYNGGKFGKSHNAVVTFTDVFGNDANVDSVDYRPSFTLTYNTTKIDNYQTAGAAPTVVGNYKVTVHLDANSNYVFADGNDCTLDFAVNKLVLKEANLGWDTVSYSLDDLDDEKFTNYIDRYVDDYFRVVRFVYTSYTGDGTQIVAGDKDTLGTYYIDNQKMYITFGRDIGTYTISFVLKDSATGNLALDSTIANEINVSFSVRQDAVTMTVEMDDFIYGNQPSKVTVIVNGGEATTGLTLTYAPVISDNAAEFAANSKTGLGLEKVDGLVYGDLSNATNFNAGYYVLSAEYRLDNGSVRRFYVFNVAKRVVTAPQSSIADTTFNGSAQNVAIDYETAYMRPEFLTAGGSFAAADGKATFTATAVGAYSIRFILIDPANNVWDTNSATGVFSDQTLTLTWNITKDVTGNGTETDPIVELPQTIDAITYGGAVDPNLVYVKDGYNGRVTLYTMPKTDDDENMPVVDSTVDGWNPTAEGWTVYNTADRGKDAGKYWLLVVVTDLTRRDFTPKATVGSFQIVPKTITASISGSMIYGTPLAETHFTNIVITGLLYGYTPTIGDYLYDYAESYANLNAGGAYEIILDTDENDVVIGIDAGSNYVVKAARGTLTINKRAVTVTIESKSSDYSVTPVLTDVQYTADGLADGEDKSVLGIEFETDATDKSAAGGTYWITIKAYDDTNYEVTQHRALYVINPLEIEVELVRQENITYGDSNIKGATAGDIIISNTDADEAFVRGDLQLVIRFTGGKGYDSFDAPTEAGTYTATLVGANSNYILIGTPSIDFVIDKKEVDVTAFYINSATYTGNSITPVVEVKKQGNQAIYAPSVYSVDECTFTNAGNHDVTVTLTDTANYVWSSTTDAAVTLVFVINKADDEQIDKLVIAGWKYGCYDVTVNSPFATVKSGERITYQYSTDGKSFTNIVPETGNAGVYYVRVSVAESQNYNAFVGEAVRFEIAKFVVKSPSLTVVTEGSGKNDVYTGGNLASNVVWFNPQLMQITYDGNIQSRGDSVTVFARDAGTYTMYISLFNAHNYSWSTGDDNNDGTLVLTWTIARKKIAKPTHDDSTKIVNGNSIVYIPVGFDSDIMAIENNSCSYGGTFDAKIKLKDTKNYEWETGDDTPFIIKWSIVGADTVFNVIISIMSVLAAIGCALILVQYLLNKSRKRVAANTMKAIEESNAQPATEQAATEQTAVEQPENQQTANEQPETEQSASEQSETEQAATEQAAPEQPQKTGKGKKGKKDQKPAEGSEGGAE